MGAHYAVRPLVAPNPQASAEAYRDLKTVATTNPANKSALLVVLGALALSGGVFAAILLGSGSTAGGKSINSGTLLQTPRTLPEFTMTDELGQPFGIEQLRGHWTLLFPGFTYCPDVCPTTLALLKQVLKTARQT